MSDPTPIRDDSTPAFPVNPPEAYPLHAAFDMPAPIVPRQPGHAAELARLLAEASELRGLLSRWLSLSETGAGCDLVHATCDALRGREVLAVETQDASIDYNAAMERLRAIANGNSGGNHAPIQYEGQG